MNTQTPDQVERDNAVLLVGHATTLSRQYVSQQDHLAATMALLANALEMLCEKQGTTCRVIFGREAQSYE
jgi:hypothetical protein